jgi:hypothetical protein
MPIHVHIHAHFISFIMMNPWFILSEGEGVRGWLQPLFIYIYLVAAL